MLSIPSKKTSILIVDDDPGFLLTIKEILVCTGMPEPALVSDSRQVMGLLEEYHFQFVLIDLMMPHICGLELLSRIKASFFDIQCVIVTAHEEIDSAVEAMKIGAYDYLTKPVAAEKLVILVKRALEQYCLRNGLSLFERKTVLSELQNSDAFSDMIAVDHAMARVLRQVEIVAPTEYSVVITGESGTGKEMIAHKIHSISNRSDGPFQAVNMGAVSETLFKDELFGHHKGAYTGASGDKKGFFESARGGTLFLDEITDLDISLQGGLLRVIQEKEFYRLGSTTTVDVDLRILAATNRDVAIEIDEGRFRADLFHRLNMFHIDIPPLRERKKDILPLAQLFLNIYACETKKNITAISDEFADYLLEYPFPGNVRELKNIIASAVLMEKGSKLTHRAIVKQSLSSATSAFSEKSNILTLEQVEKRHICHVLEKLDNNRTKAAKVLGIGRKTLQRKLKSYGIM